MIKRRMEMGSLSLADIVLPDDDEGVASKLSAAANVPAYVPKVPKVKPGQEQLALLL